MSDSDMDDAVLAVTQTSWKKVAMIIVKVAERLGGQVPEGHDGHVLIAKRINSLVQDGKLVAQGDVRSWRNAEVRRP